MSGRSPELALPPDVQALPADYGFAHSLGGLVVTLAATEAYGLITDPSAPLTQYEGRPVADSLGRMQANARPRADIVVVAPEEVPAIPGIASVEEVGSNMEGRSGYARHEGLQLMVWLSGSRAEIVNDLVDQGLTQIRELGGNPDLQEEEVQLGPAICRCAPW
jgi:hypothetical protein